MADGYRQTQIAKKLGLSDVAISKIRKIEKRKEKLFEAQLKKGIFWSYDKGISFKNIGDVIFIEHVLKYGDYDDIVELFELYGKRKILAVWVDTLKDDARFLKLNLFLARVFFGMDVEADFFKGGISGREKKLRMLAS